MNLLSDLKKIRVQHVDRDAKGVEIKTDVDVITDADCITMDDGDLRSGVKKMIDDRIGEVIDGAPEELDTLKELATELEKNQSGVSTILNKMNDKIDKSQVDDAYSSDSSDTVPSSKALSDGLTILEHTIAHNQDVIEEMINGFYTEYEKEIKLKVDKVDGKGLSTLDFTDVLKNKLDNIEDGAQKNKVTSVNGMTGDVVIEVGSGNVDLSEYAKTSDVDEKLKSKAGISQIAMINRRLSSNDTSLRDINERLDNTNVELGKKADKTEIADFKRCIVLSSDAYSKLSDEEKAKSDTLYFLL